MRISRKKFRTFSAIFVSRPTARLCAEVGGKQVWLTLLLT